ncbi:hypothetical protein GALMADRAFT_210405 [Galerina marginata CBS 339.88]|uniref:Uncharacterized protein n=1 Tax=Galerina marginata (strain CBS 339.88) TaxID=685588 RepID=A0A067T2D8_GALM3|nr:hypothetical protein GALMADRAFT_210405 [Galerina marginata CBS 339.88]
MTTLISITTSSKDQLVAASLLSQYLEELGCKHAYIGGFAWALLGSVRPTEIRPFFYQQVINLSLNYVLVEAKNFDIKEIRDKLSKHNKQFALAGIKLFFVKVTLFLPPDISQPDPAASKELIRDLQDDALVRASRDNVLIETLKAGTLGLPAIAGPIYPIEQEFGKDLPVLHPAILILTKMKRWSHNYESDRPKTVLKNKSDQADLDFIIYWLEENKMTIEFELYQGKTKEELLNFVRRYRNRFHENAKLMEAMENVVKPDDWKLLDE